MQLIIENLRGVRSASVPLNEGITMFCGRNGSGKSSVILALQALVTRDPLVSGIKKKDAAALIFNSGWGGLPSENKAASAKLQYPDGGAEIKWPSCKMTGEDNLPFVSKYAAGVELPTSIPAKELAGILGILPTFEDFVGELEAVLAADYTDEDTDKTIKQLWTLITKSGWDGAWEQVKGKGVELKREWQRLANREWGTDIGKKFIPDNYVAGKSKEELEQAVLTAQKLFEFALKSEALGDKEKQDLQKLAEDIEPTKLKIAGLRVQITSVNDELAKVQALKEAIPAAINTQKAYECDGCGRMGIIHGDKLIAAPDPKAAAADIAASRTKIAESNQKITEIQAKRDQLNLDLQSLRQHLDKCQEASRKLNTVNIDAAPPTLTVEDARKEISTAEAALKAHNIKAECDEIHDSLGMNQFIVSVLAPEGLRKQVLSQKLESFNELLSVICENAETWPVIAIDEFLDTRFDGRPYLLLSPGEQLCVNLCLQIALAKLDKSQMIIMDGVDLLDARLFQGLMNVLNAIPIQSILGLKVDDVEDAPNCSFWCDHGSVAVPF